MSGSGAFLHDIGVPGLVSVIIPTFNRQDLVGAAIESTLTQTYPTLEAIVVDDGSTDDTRREVERHRDDRVRYFYKPNGGLSSARNHGLDRARGEFIAFLDSDDVWFPWKLAAQLALFRRHDAVGMTWSDMSTFREPGTLLDTRFLRTYYTAYGQIDFERICRRLGSVRDLCPDAPREWLDCPYYVGDIADAMFLGNLVHPPTAIVRREWLRRSGPFEPDVTGSGSEDHHFYYRIAELGPVALLDAPTIWYRRHEGQMSTTHSLHEARADVRLLAYWMRRRPPALPATMVRARIAASHRWAGYEELHGGDRRAATRLLWHSLTLEPLQPRIAGLLLASLLPRRALPAARAAKRALEGAAAAMLLRIAALSGLIYLLLRLFVLEPELAEV